MKSITYPSITALLLCLLMTSVVFGQETTETPDTETVSPIDIPANRDAAREEIEANRAAAIQTREAALADRDAIADGIAENREAIIEEQEATRAAGIETREQRQVELQAQQAERRSALTDRAKERITNLAANVSNRMDAAAARMQDIINRLDSRIDKLEAAGLDTTQAAAALASAQTSVTAAISELSRIDVIVQNAVTAEDPRAAWASVKVTYGGIRAQLQTAHTEIKASVQALKEAARAAEDNRGAAAAVQNNTQISDDAAEDTITSETAEAVE